MPGGVRGGGFWVKGGGVKGGEVKGGLTPLESLSPLIKCSIPPKFHFTTPILCERL